MSAPEDLTDRRARIGGPAGTARVDVFAADLGSETAWRYDADVSTDGTPETRLSLARALEREARRLRRANAGL